ncbi:MAG: glucosaminidase domain-containing protein [Colwellia sp.]|nr:glucosaminidase domain-containing protein [Colwellia sp.]
MKLHHFFKTIVIGALFIALIAPFSFLKPTIKPPIAVVEKPVAPVVAKKVIEQPLHNVVLPNFAVIRDVKEKKRQFFEFIYPAIEQQNNNLLALRAEVFTMLAALSLEENLLPEQLALLTRLIKKYKVSTKYSPLQQLDELLLRIDIVPSELILVQAANESAWGTSRFAKIGLNFFGMWCYKKGCGMVPGGRDEGARHEVAAFNSVEHGVQRYLHNINTNHAYTVFRTIRGQLRTQEQPLSPQILATGLLRYSIRGTDYVLEITEMIRHNQVYFDDILSKPLEISMEKPMTL